MDNPSTERTATIDAADEDVAEEMVNPASKEEEPTSKDGEIELAEPEIADDLDLPQFPELVRGGLIRRWDGQIRRLEMKKRFEQVKNIPHHVEPTRLELFVDAVFAVIATVLYLPLMSSLAVTDESGGGDPTSNSSGISYRSEGGDSGEGEKTVSRLAIGLVALLSFYMVILVHLKHLKVCFWMAKDDRATMAFQMLVILFSSLIPYSNALINSYVSHITVCIYAGIMALLGFVFAFWWLYLARKPELQRFRSRRQIFDNLIVIGSWVAISVLAGTVTFALPADKASLSLIIYAIFPFARMLQRIIPCERFVVSDSNTLSVSGRRIPGFCSVERFVCFSDAVLAFSATLISADLSISPFEENPRELIAYIAPQLIAFIWCLTIIGLVWLVQSTIVRTINRIPEQVFWPNVLLVGMTPTLAFGCKFVLLSFQHGEQLGVSKNIAVTCLAASQTITALALALLLQAVGRRKHIWRSGCSLLWRSKSWYYEAIFGLVIFLLMNILALAIAYPAPIASLVFLIGAVAFLLVWIFATSFFTSVAEEEEKPLDTDHLEFHGGDIAVNSNIQIDTDASTDSEQDVAQQEPDESSALLIGRTDRRSANDPLD